MRALTTCAGVHAFGHGDGGGSRGGRGGRKEREAERDEAGAGGCGVDLRVVDEGDAAFLEIAACLAGDVVERGAETGDRERLRGCTRFRP